LDTKIVLFVSIFFTAKGTFMANLHQETNLLYNLIKTFSKNISYSISERLSLYHSYLCQTLYGGDVKIR
jgi:hypothetical protein